ncbi:6537_t:CDS:10 [Acaulospora morrowiae]|uniref:6537_t:CDS:1 n=1 Tax=Acaulospora morrowiae TaxID=94023 RepID=A0A9N9A4U2_9GLOM|nr:6537_t:CDS:10 [Acaulospora morrowiae]
MDNEQTEIVEIHDQQPSLDNYDETSDEASDETNTNDSREGSNTGKGRFQKVAKRVISLNRILTAENIWSAGQDPGIDAYTADSNIYVSEGKQSLEAKFLNIYSCNSPFAEGQSKTELTNGTLSEFLKQERPKDSKVRWINVDGISWDVVKVLAIHYDLHPLSVEDIMQGSQRVKMDPYHNHIYVSLLLHILDEMDDVRNSGRDSMTFESNNFRRRSILRAQSRINLLQHGHREGSRYLEAHKELRKMKLSVAVEQVNIILRNDGTLITIFQHSGKLVYNPILSRIDHPKTILRTSQDASLLMEAVIDAIVDLALPIIDSYRHQIAELEGKLLIQPKIDYMRELHMISGELALLKKTLAPVKGLVSILTKHGDKSLLSEVAKVYFSDVSDHCIDIEDNLEAMFKITENLVFNLIAYDTNQNMAIIAIISIVFLPMTFIAGFFGMNFVNFPELQLPLRHLFLVGDRHQFRRDVCDVYLSHVVQVDYKILQKLSKKETKCII